MLKQIEIKDSKNILNPNDFTVLTEIIDRGNFYGEPVKLKYITFNCQDIEIAPIMEGEKFANLSFVFQNYINYSLVYRMCPIGFHSNIVNTIKIYEHEQEKTFDELTNGILI